MTSRDFCYWLQGYFEVSEAKIMNKTQLNQVKKHLNLVFKHEIDPSMGDESHQNGLNMIHNPQTLFPHNDSNDGLLRC